MAEKKPSLLRLSPEAKVGLFVLLGIILLVYMSLRLGGIRLGGKEGYSLHVFFTSAAGLDKNASVRVAGVEVGRVKDIRLEDYKAHLILDIRPDVTIRKDFTAVLTSKGLLGEKYVELIPGSPNAPALQEGDTITRTASYADLDKLITVLTDVASDVKNVTETLSSVLGGPEGEESLRNIVSNIEDITANVNRIVEKNDDKLNNIMANLDSFTALLSREGPEIAGEIKTAARNLNSALLETSTNLNSMINENRGNLKEGVENLKVASVKLQQAMDTLNNVTKEVGPEISKTVTSVNSIARKIDTGQGTLGRLVNDASMHENINKTITGINKYIQKTEDFRTFLSFRSEYLLEPSETKNYFSLRVQPKADKYYLVEIVDDPRGKITRETRQLTVNGATTNITDVKTSETFKFSAQIAKRFGNLVVRGGLIESSGGVGLDYNFFKDRMKLTFEAFDFGREDNAHLKAFGTLYLNKFFFFSAGWDDFASDYNLDSAFVGLGLQFEDEDIKYLLSAAPISF